MININSPPQHPQSKLKQVNSKRLNTTLFRFLRRIKGFFAAKKLPYVANKACKVYLGNADKAHHDRCSRILQTRLKINPTQLSRFFHTSIGKNLLAWFEQFFHLSEEHESKLTLKDILLQMVSDPEGLSILSFLRRYPNPIQVDADQLLFTAKELELLLRRTKTTLDLVRTLSQGEAQTDPNYNFASLPDLRHSGIFEVKQYTLNLKRKPQKIHSESLSHPLSVVCYQPQPLPEEKVSVVVQSHGLASNPEDLAVYAQHLASHGYFVVAPWHYGSDTTQIRNMLAGKSSELFNLMEFVDRPWDIHYLLDELERRNNSEFQGKLNLSEVGIMGRSFGAYTALALGGAEIHFEKLETSCNITKAETNISLLLQCQALGLPRQYYNLKDDRIRAILTLDSVGSAVFAAQGIKKIQVPVMLIAGSQDATTPLTLEQIRIFQWLRTSYHYLALIEGKPHVRDMQQWIHDIDLQIKVSSQEKLISDQDSCDSYIKALSLAFFNRYITPSKEGTLFLSSNYANYLNDSSFKLWLISQASSQDLRQMI